MEIILKTDVDNLGYKDDVVTVKNGYARNFLIPKGFAVLATESAKKVLAENIRQKSHKEAKEIEEAKNTANALSQLEVKMETKVGQGNKLFGSISNADLADKLDSLGHGIERKYIQIVGGTVKALGTYTAKIRLHRDVSVDLEFDVVAQK